MNQRSIGTIVILVLALPMALLLGQWAATDPIMAIGFGLAIAVAVTVMMLGKNLWALVFLAFPFVGALNALPVSISVRDLATLGVAALMFPMMLFRSVRAKLRVGAIEISLFVLFLTILQSFVRNPAGFAALGSETLGGRSNFEMAVAALLFVVISTQVVPLAWVKRTVWFYVAAQILAAGLESAINLFPAAGLYIYAIYRPSYAGGLGEALMGGPAETSLGRMPFFQELARTLGRLLVSLHAPLALANPLKPRIIVVFITLTLALLTGFRSLIAGMALFAIFSAILRKRYVDLVVLGMVGFCFYAFLAVGNNNFFTLPLPAQRALSVLPGNWDARAIQDAKGSGEWRFEMWQQALGTDRYIQNKILGDGYSIPPDVCIYQQRMQVGMISSEQLQEYYLLIGGYHSGPVETVRRTGYLGLLVLLVCQVVIFREAFSTVRGLRGTEFFNSAIFASLPLIAGPFIFWFVVGAYHTEVISICFNAAWLRLIQNSAAAHPNALAVTDLETEASSEAVNAMPGREGVAPVLGR
jgi:hypothetical protein